jgi:hypothetical protein
VAAQPETEQGEQRDAHPHPQIGQCEKVPEGFNHGGPAL